MPIEFTKMHGIGNDFIVINALEKPLALTNEEISRLAHRRFGIGFDQLLVVEPPSSTEAEFNYRIYNADGGEVENCGNGARCFARYVTDKALTTSDNIRVMTKRRRRAPWTTAGIAPAFSEPRKRRVYAGR